MTQGRMKYMSISKDYAKAYTEVYEILKHISQDEFEKLPDNLLELIEVNRDRKYVFHFDNSKETARFLT